MSEERQSKCTAQPVLELILSCDLSKALNALARAPRKKITEELVQKIRDLHPKVEAEHCFPQSASIKNFNDNILVRVIKDLRTHTAPDMTGLLDDR